MGEKWKCWAWETFADKHLPGKIFRQCAVLDNKHCLVKCLDKLKFIVALQVTGIIISNANTLPKNGEMWLETIRTYSFCCFIS